MRNTRNTSKTAVAMLAVYALAGGATIADAQPTKHRHGKASAALSDKINGQPLPMTPARSTSEVRVLSTVLKDAKGRPTGMKLLSHLTVRAAGTRSPIHTHPYGGQTCIQSGEMTLYLEGAKTPQKAVAGQCYWMPPFKRMSGVNTGTTDAVMIDSFVVPSEDKIWVVVEPGMMKEQNQFNASAKLHKH